MQQCSRCGQEKSADRFYLYKPACKDCLAAERARWHAANKEKSLAISQAWKLRNGEQLKDYGARRRVSMRAERNAQSIAWRAANKAKVKEYNADYLQSNRAAQNARVMQRHAAKRNAVPGWANKERMAEIYARAARVSMELGQRFDVDHIVPLQSQLVCGLHVEANLQILDYQSNLRKGNRVWPDMPEIQTTSPSPFRSVRSI